ncbi:MAG: hypothetical protein K9I85_15880 [Saprospiraceae bacterium]|nr:hypothetical protein [Saprospiraceae bacterium]
MSLLTKTLLLVGLLLCGIMAQAQNFLSDFTLAAGNGKVVLNWTVSAGNTCLGIGIVRATDEQNFIPIGNIGGICGSTTEAVSYSFVDEAPVPNKINSYKLLLGLSGESEVLSVEIIDLGSTGYQVRPQPMGDHGQIYFENNGGEPHLLSLLTLHGQLLYEQSTASNRFLLDLSPYPAGFLVFIIRDLKSGEIKAKGKVMRL